MKPPRAILVVLFVFAALCCWVSVLALQRERVRVSRPHLIHHSSLGSTASLYTVTGIMTDPNFRVVIGALEQRTGVDTLPEPKVVVTSRNHAINRMDPVGTTFYITNR